MEIFEINGNVVRPTAQALAVKCFKKLWTRDKTKDKSVALQEFAYVEFMTSKKKNNPYKGYDESIREKKIIQGVIVEEDWKPDEYVKACIEFWQDWQNNGSESIRYFNANVSALDKTINFLENELD